MRVFRTRFFSSNRCGGGKLLWTTQLDAAVLYCMLKVFFLSILPSFLCFRLLYVEVGVGVAISLGFYFLRF